MKIAVSYLKSNDYKSVIKKLNDTNINYIHADLCDGKYVETKNFNKFTIKGILKTSKKPLNIHLMVNNPKKYISCFKNLNVDEIIIHNINNALENINYLKSLNIKVGIAVNPDEDIILFKKYFSIVDTILIMSVNPGKGGQTFIESVIKKLDYLNEIKSKYNFNIAIDGGINDKTYKLIKGKADLVICGSFITNSDDYQKQINKLKNS